MLPFPSSSPSPLVCVTSAFQTLCVHDLVPNLGVLCGLIGIAPVSPDMDRAMMTQCVYQASEIANAEPRTWDRWVL
jgi:hypothetical protein